MCIQSLQFTALVLCQSRCNSALKFALTRRWKEDLVCNPLKLDKLEKICMNLDWSMEWTNSQSIIKNLSHVLLFQNLSFLFLPVNLESGLTSLPFLLARSWKFSIPYLFSFFKRFSWDHHTFFSWIQSLLFLTLFPLIFFIFSLRLSNLESMQAMPFHSRWWSSKASTCRLSPTLSRSSSPCSNTSCSSLLSKCCWQRLGSSSHQHEEELLRLELRW